MANAKTKKSAMLSEMQYTFELKEAAIKAERNQREALATAEIKKQKIVRNFLVAGTLLLIAFGVYIVYNIRKRKKFEMLNALSEQRMRISRELHDDIGSTLGSIAVFSDVARNNASKNARTSEMLSRIGVASRELIDKMGDIVWSLNPDNENVEKLQDRMRSFGTAILVPRNVNIEYKFDDPIPISIDGSVIKNIFLIYKEAIHNIVKYADCKNVSVSLTWKDQHLVFTINDDGKGFNVNGNGPVHNGNGLKNINARSLEMKAAFHIASEINRGTKLLVSIPVT
jgi:signal transduction histidine kinase